MRRFLKILGGVLVVLLVFVVGAVAYVLNIDLNDWKPEIQEAVRENTGRQLVIDGPIEFDLGSDTYFKATGISLSNADWASREQMVEIGTVELGFKLFSLLGNTPDITMIRVDGVRAALETSADGTMANTRFETGDDMRDDRDHGGGGGDLVLPIIRDLQITDVQVDMIQHLGDGANEVQTFTLTELALGGDSATAPLLLNLDAAFEDLPLIMAGTMGSLQSMTDGAQPTPIDFVGNLAGIDVAINGAIQDLAGQEGIDVTISALGQELAEAAGAFGIDVPSLGQFKVDVTLAGSGDALSINPLSVDIGTADVIHILVDGQIEDAIGQEGINVTVNLESVEVGNLSPITQAFAGQDVPAVGPLNVSFAVRGGLGDGLDLSDLSAAVGSEDLILASAGGNIADLTTDPTLDLAIRVDSPQIGDLSPIAQQFAGQSVPPLGRLALSANVAGSPHSGLSLQDMNLSLGSAEALILNVVGSVGDLVRSEGIDIEVTANSPELGNLSDIAEEYSGQGIPDIGPMDMIAKVSGGLESGLALSDLALDFGRPETIQIQAAGGIADLMAQTGVDLTVNAVSPEVGNLSPLVEAFTPMAVPALGPLDMAARVSGDANGTMSLSDLALSLGKAETLLVEASGSVSDLVALSGADLGFSVVSPDLSVLSDLAGTDVPPIGPVDISGNLTGDAGEPITLDPFTAKIGDSDISGTATLDGTGDVPSIVATLSSDYFNLNDVMPASEGGESGGGAASSNRTAAQGGADDGRVIPGDRIPFEAMRAINVEIQYTAGTFIGAISELNNLEVGVSLQGGDLRVDPLNANVGDGTLTGTISLGGGDATHPLNVNLTGRAMDLSRLLAEAGFRDKIVGPLRLDVALTGQGSNPRDIAASLNGNVGLTMYDSRVLKAAFEDAMGPTLAGIMSSENGWIVIDCAVFDYDISNGLMNTVAGYTASGPVTVTSEGEIDLRTERLSLDVKPSGGAGIVSLSVPLDVTGTFASPTVTPDPIAVGGGILAGVLTGGVGTALLALVADLPDGHPCQEEVAESQEQAQSPSTPENADSPGNVIQNPGSAVEGVGEAIGEGVGDALNNLFGN